MLLGEARNEPMQKTPDSLGQGSRLPQTGAASFPPMAVSYNYNRYLITCRWATALLRQYFGRC